MKYIYLFFEICVNIVKGIYHHIIYSIYYKIEYYLILKYKKIKLKFLYDKYKNSNDEFNKSLNLQTWYAIGLNKKDLKEYLKDLGNRREMMHNTNI